jgi:hypothetical protein
LIEGTFDDAWLRDGIDTGEALVVDIMIGFGDISPPTPANALYALGAGLVLYHPVELPLSGAKTLVVFGGDPNRRDYLSITLRLILAHIAGIESFAGAYPPAVLAVELVEEIPGVSCGTIIQPPFEGAAGLIRLEPVCVDEGILVHEMGHLVVGGGPVWFDEGVADLVMLHQLTREGTYLSLPVSGKIDLRGPRAFPTLQSKDSYTLQQGALGAKLLAEVYRTMGIEAMSAALQEIGRLPRLREAREPQLIVDIIVGHAPEETRADVQALIEERIDFRR